MVAHPFSEGNHAGTGFLSYYYESINKYILGVFHKNIFFRFMQQSTLFYCPC